MLVNDSENSSTYRIVSDTLKLEEHITLLKNQISHLQYEEIKRITRECLKHGNNVKPIIGYLTGVENIEKFLVVTKKEIKAIEEKKESITTFTFTSKLIPKFKSSARLIY